MIYAVYFLLFAGAFWVVAQVLVGLLKRSYRKYKVAFDARVKELDFIVSKEVEHDFKALYIDDINKRWIVRDDLHDVAPRVFNYTDILEFELIVDGYCVVRSGVGGAIVGGALLGVQGAIAGGIATSGGGSVCTSMQVVIRLNCLDCPQVVIRTVWSKTEKNSSDFKAAHSFAQKLMSLLTYIEHNKEVEFEECLKHLEV